MGGRGRRFRPARRSSHDERKRRETSHHDRHQPEAVHKAERARLALDGPVGHRQRFVSGGYCIISLRQEHIFQAIQHLLEVRVGVVGVRRERLLVRLILAGQERTQQRSANAAAQIAREIRHAGNLIVLLARNANVVQRADRYKDQRHEHYLDHAQQDHRAEIDSQIHHGKEMQRYRGAEKSDADEQTRIYLGCGESSRNRHHQHENQTSRRERQARQLRRISQTALQEFRYQHRRPEQNHSQHKREEYRRPEITIFQKPHIHDGMVVIPLPQKESDERGYADAEHRRDHRRAEPIVFLALVENELEAARHRSQ